MATANLGFEEKLWGMADKLRGSMDAAEYKHVALGLLFLKYVSDAFEEKYEALKKEPYADPEDRDEYLAANIFWVPKDARWSNIKENAKKPEIGQIIDQAMMDIERENPSLKGVLPKDYARPALDKTRLGEVIDLFSFKVGDEESRSQDVLGRVYEYFLSKFASAEGKNGGEFYTPSSVVQLLVAMIEPYKGRVYDPCCGSGGMFVQSEKFVEERQGKLGDIAVYGQESNPTTWRLCKMNLAIRGIDSNLGESHADTFHNDLHKSLKADYILANPPFNISDWGGDRLTEDARWSFGIPPAGNANYAWIQHMVNKLAPNGVAGFVLANGSMSTSTTAELEIRSKLVNADLVDCIVTLPGQLFYSTQIPVCLWFLAKNKTPRGLRDRRGQILFIDARKMGHMVDRTHRELSAEDIKKVADTYHAWRGQAEAGTYEDVKGFCKAAKLGEVQEHEYILTPGRYVGIEDVEEESEPFEDKMARLTAELAEQFAKSRQLEDEIRKQLGGIGFEFLSN
ncbi:type I restriction-modification system subunit M [Paenibacillus thiaminolyticus]|uniref:site-specific DNA-methyltransferase (adenine-specific) n=1 Tax=Paenibacillus thiaminolyticus TaxID=49283 RepID=A0AAP9J1S9_PANTH|nr:class I SAM-dependent DNA methyltransferase [Paenibacillus thiaminolyticus]MCY9538723.1 type I restriction-modification system subunit M [Paenibacillus thiaminolyticus]MCY9600398.1 type I restriction-modification system subunit M [Paenibacillus thiaminolyticus]MCY9607272.1 type I restriction-modification system subunit M [Paenibacillus thiaminolyticus]MCY9614463.1 type I restriction-modification system subunit M [Paenibacillus thiaminolyticus]MCY9621507.1 type I restriction-modification sys